MQKRTYFTKSIIHAKFTFLGPTCINCYGDISLHAWLNIADQKLSAIMDAMLSCVFNLCDVHMRIAITCIVFPLLCAQGLPQGSSITTLLLHVFVLAEIYCCNPRLNVIVIPGVITRLGLVVA